MEITKVKIIPVKHGNMLASADITVDNCLLFMIFRLSKDQRDYFFLCRVGS